MLAERTNSPHQKIPTGNTMGAPACPGVPWGLAFETWDPPDKGRYNSQNVYVGKSLLNFAQVPDQVGLEHHSVPQGRLNYARTQSGVASTVGTMFTHTP
jgi:hypothetical protein